MLQGNYRELRWFTPWFKQKAIEDHVLPPSIQDITGGLTWHIVGESLRLCCFVQ